ncbi:MAG: hypothetical protein RLZZ21_909, partial [Planctomycetota bacterium]
MRRRLRSHSFGAGLLACLGCLAYLGVIDGVVAGDPRPTADVSAGGQPQADRRPSRRSLRRAARRGLPIESQQQPSLPIVVDATLGSPFQPDAAERPTVHRDQPYGAAADSRQRFDIHLPPGCSGGSLPLVVWIPGDEWQGGPRTSCPVTWLVDHGYVVASIGYRPGDTAIFPAQLDDCRAALATFIRDAEIWGIDPARICVMGAGGGGQLAALVGATTHGGLPRPADGDPAPAVAAVCAIAAPSQLTSLGANHDRAG